jgi:hypothetical protein
MHLTSLDLSGQSQAVAHVFLDSQEMVPMAKSLPMRQSQGGTELETPSALGRPHGLSSEVSAGWAYGNPLHRHLFRLSEQMVAVFRSLHNWVSSPPEEAID